MKRKIIIITGDIHSGKTTYAVDYIKEQQGKKRLAGIIAHGIYEDHAGEKSGFEIESIATGEKRILISSRYSPDSIAVGRFFISSSSLRWAEDEIRRGIESDSIIVDEIGPLELKKKGYYDVVNWLLDSFDGDIVLVVRASLVGQVIELFHLDEDQIEIRRVRSISV